MPSSLQGVSLESFQTCFISQVDKVSQLILGGSIGAQFIWEKLANHFPKGQIQEKNNSAKGHVLMEINSEVVSL